MVSRRGFLKAVCAGLLLYPMKNSAAFTKQERFLDMYNTHTGEELSVHYLSSGIYDPDALNRINHFLRCHYTGEVVEIDTGVLDLMCDIKDAIPGAKKIEIVSGYRSPQYNNLLVSLGRNVSKKSLHMQGRAIDLTLGQIPVSTLAKAAKSFSAGGVGEYPHFVHIDVGRVRYW